MAYRLPDSQAQIAAILAAHGPLTHHEPVAPELIASYEGRVPDLVLDFWENHGIGELSNGLLKLCMPEMFAEPLAMLFADDPDFGEGTFALAYGPFGNLILWNQNEWLALLAHPSATVDAPFFHKSKAGLDPNKIALDYFLNGDPRIMDVYDDAGEEMYERAVEKLGELRPGLIYCLLPADSFRTVDVESLEIVVADEWMIERFAGQVYTIHDLMDNRLNIRPVGRAA